MIFRNYSERRLSEEYKKKKETFAMKYHPALRLSDPTSNPGT